MKEIYNDTENVVRFLKWVSKNREKSLTKPCLYRKNKNDIS